MAKVDTFKFVSSLDLVDKHLMLMYNKKKSSVKLKSINKSLMKNITRYYI